MHYGPRYRLTPPWPPGLEAIKKALLGPARYRSTTISIGKIVGPYDDTLLIALAVNAYLDNRPDGFSLKASDLQLRCRLDTQLDRDALDRMLLDFSRADFSSQSWEEALLASRIEIASSVGDIEIAHSSWICRKSKGNKSVKWNPAFRGAVELLQARRTQGL